MAYTVDVSLLDLGGYFVDGTPTFTGSIFSPPPASGSSPAPFSTATSTTPATTILFTSGGVPPAGNATMLVTATAPPSNPILGDLFRSGFLLALPPSPSQVSVLTLPFHSISVADLNSTVGKAISTPLAVPIPGSVIAAVGALSGGLFIPQSLAITSVTPALIPASAGSPPAISINVTGSLVVTQFVFFTVTHVFSLVASYGLTPSSDTSNTQRVFQLAVTGVPTFKATGIADFIVAPFAGLLSGQLGSFLEAGLNAALPSAVSSALASLGKELAPTTVISALNPTITASGITIRLVLADLFGPAIEPIPGTLGIGITPPVQLRETLTYTVTITNVANGQPVAGATVSLTQFEDGGAKDITTEITNAAGQVSFTADLTPVMLAVGGSKGPPVIITLNPTLSVEAQGFNSVTLTL